MTRSHAFLTATNTFAHHTIPSGLAVAVALFVSSACITVNPGAGDAQTNTCPAGAKECTCYGNHTCDLGLECRSNICIAPSGGASAAVGGTSSRLTSAATLVNGIAGGVGKTSGSAGQRAANEWSASGGFTAMPETGGSSNSQTNAAGTGGATSATRNYAGGAAVATSVSPGGGSSSGGATSAGATSTSLSSSGGRSGATSAAQSGGSSGTYNTRAAGGTSAGSTRTGIGGDATGGGVNTSRPAWSCSTSTDLIAEADKSDTKNWIGGDAASTDDNPCGVQGSVYAYGDTGLDRAQFNADDTIQSPRPDESSAAPDDFLSPCSGGNCCIKGKTSKWPMDVSGRADYTASVWGGGIGIALNDPGSGSIRLPYQGPATGFAITLSGTLNGQAVRLEYTQSSDATMTPPFKEISRLGTYELPFKSVSCPSWAAIDKCNTVSTHPYELWVQVIGGDAAGDFELCIDHVTPLP